ncbi:MAG: response regulator transcription factor [Solirubrobacteraceae bacterium]|jgi:DNA-binding NarL/FixJ family response regulator|nr:response regulator transcription factor [Solirubrobacteraceae bacterium]MCU0506331.1 response regulator transcription factor [Chloroflexota bacterium]
MTIRVAIADDEALVRGGFRAILDAEPDLDVVAEAADGRQALGAAARFRPDVIVMDIRMPELDGLAATRQLRTTHPAVRVLIVTTFDLDEYVYDALLAGAAGFLLKDARPTELITAVRAVASGDALIAPRVTRRLIEAFVAARPRTVPEDARITGLSEREREILLLLARGLSNREIAEHVHLSEATIKTHVASVLAKLQVRDRVRAVIVAYESGLVVPSGP